MKRDFPVKNRGKSFLGGGTESTKAQGLKRTSLAKVLAYSGNSPRYGWSKRLVRKRVVLVIGGWLIPCGILDSMLRF